MRQGSEIDLWIMELEPGEKEKFLKDFGKNLEALIYERFKSKDQFLSETGFYKANLHEIITGKVDAQLSTIFRLAKALGVSMEELVRVDKPVRIEKPKGKAK